MHVGLDVHNGFDSHDRFDSPDGFDDQDGHKNNNGLNEQNGLDGHDNHIGLDGHSKVNAMNPAYAAGIRASRQEDGGRSLMDHPGRPGFSLQGKLEKVWFSKRLFVGWR